MILGYLSFISVFESRLKPSSDAESALASHVTLTVALVQHTGSRHNNLSSRFGFLSIPKSMSHTSTVSNRRVS